MHRAQLRLLHGEWDEAEQGALRIAKDFDRQRVDYAAEAWYVVAEVRRLRGKADAADVYDEAHARGRDPQPGRALLRMQQGDALGAGPRSALRSQRRATTRCAGPRYARRRSTSPSQPGGWRKLLQPPPSWLQRQRRTPPRV